MPCQAPHGLEEDEDATFPAEPEAPLALPMDMGGEIWGGDVGRRGSLHNCHPRIIAIQDSHTLKL